MSLNDTFTSTGHKFFAHQEAMANLRNGRGQPIVTHVMLTDVCNHSCAFCSVQARAGDSLPFDDVVSYLKILVGYGLKAVILSGGGNPILYKCKSTKADFNDVVAAIHRMGLEIGLITNGMPLKSWGWKEDSKGEWWNEDHILTRNSWKSVLPSTLDKLTWVRISMSGLDHEEREVYVPDIDPSKTTLGFSYVGHDIYEEPADPHHGKVSTTRDLLTLGTARVGLKTQWMEERLPELIKQIGDYVQRYNPRYVRLLPNCLEPSKIKQRCLLMKGMAFHINNVYAGGRDVVFVQHKPPAAPKACLLGAVHPVLNADGYCYPCDSCVLNETAGHAFSQSWRMCHWSDIGKLYENKLPYSLIKDPAKQCPGCVFTRSNEILEGVRDGTIEAVPPMVMPDHVNFI